MSLVNIILQIISLRSEAKRELFTFGEYFLLIMNGAFNFIHGLNPIKKGKGHVMSLVGNKNYFFKFL